MNGWIDGWMDGIGLDGWMETDRQCNEEIKILNDQQEQHLTSQKHLINGKQM